MPPVSKKLDVNVKVSVSRRFITDITVKTILLREHDWNEPRLSFQGKTIARSEENDKVMYDVLLDEANGHILKLIEAEDLLQDAVDEKSIDLTSSRGWTAGEVYVDSRLSGSGEGFTSLNSRLIMNNGRYASPLDYFLFFLPVDHFYSIIHSTNLHARSLGHWEDITFHEYHMWIALLTVMTVVKHGDRKAYWRQG
ncbi:hypothetical protein G6F70_008125 [Rhizopus microsporus]|nr:hypothetical protein G6F71_002230 [Rhizopus microsporus]KAG1195582.1 hypothetical protein G6F70_008125 [Rhizopus microsporus]KAG1207415.1 hypothetical protein G6F69_008070 [Rhizopus microsporus]KAG1228084.1 hypothetical protein G6F67_008043 [Rhizopus microsporus]KAG1260101.1 hypothetical protein G6F68_007677 [Rhizopus microsporus]